MISTYLLFLDGRNPASPAADKKQRQRLKMSQEKKDAKREKERLSKNAKRKWKPRRKVLNAGRLILNV